MSEALWAFGRISGIVALILFTVAVLLGVVTRSGRPLPGLPRFSVTLVHRNAAILASVFLVFHVGTLMLDSYAKLNPIDVLVPFLGAFRPFWQGLGTVAFDLLLAVMVTGLLRRWVGVRTFRAVHWLTYAIWPIAVAHGIGNGTNGTSRWFLLITAVCATAVLAGVIWRVSARFVELSHIRDQALR